MRSIDASAALRNSEELHGQGAGRSEFGPRRHDLAAADPIVRSFGYTGRMSHDRLPAVMLRPTLRRLGMLLLGVVLCLRALALPLDMAGHAMPPATAAGIAATGVPTAAHEAPAASAAAGGRHALPGASPTTPDPHLALSGDPVCHDGQDTLPTQDAPTDARVCQILCAVACAPLLLPMPLVVAHDGGERQPERAPLLPHGVVPAPEHRPPIA